MLFSEKILTEGVSCLSDLNVVGYRKKTTKQLIKAIEECKSLSQLFALIQHENISIQMTGQVGASNLTPKTLSPKEITNKKDEPFERLKSQVKKAVLDDMAMLKRSKLIAQRERERHNRKNNTK